MKIVKFLYNTYVKGAPRLPNGNIKSMNSYTTATGKNISNYWYQLGPEDYILYHYENDWVTRIERCSEPDHSEMFDALLSKTLTEPK